MNARTLLVSSFSEDDNAVYFALLDNGTAEVFSALKNNSEPAAKIAITGFRTRRYTARTRSRTAALCLAETADLPC